MADRFSAFKPTLDTSTYSDAFAIVPSDTTIFSQPTKAIYVGGSGNVYVQMAGTTSNNANLVFKMVQAGQSLEVRVQRIFANTTATDIIGLY